MCAHARVYIRAGTCSPPMDLPRRVHARTRFQTNRYAYARNAQCMHMHAILNVMHMHAKLNVMHMHEMLNVMHMHAMLNVMHMHAKLNVILSRLHTVNICSKHPLLCLRTLTLEPAVGVAQLRAAPRPSLSLVRLHPNALVNGWATRTGISLVNG